MSSGSRPRGRPRKDAGRMDAAINAMKVYGFPERLIVETVKELLRVYGIGVEGWNFIEDARHTVLFEKLLDKQKEHDAAPPEDYARQQNDPPQLEDNTVHIQDPAQLELNIQDKQDSAEHEQDIGQLEDNAQNEQNISIHGSLGDDVAAPAFEAATDGGGNGGEIVILDSPCKSQPVIPKSGKEDDCEQILASPVGSEPEPPHKRCSGRIWRRRFHGWLSDSEGEQEVIDLEPELPAHLQNIIDMKICDGSKKQLRQSRWDLRPEDM